MYPILALVFCSVLCEAAASQTGDESDVFCRSHVGKTPTVTKLCDALMNIRNQLAKEVADEFAGMTLKKRYQLSDPWNFFGTTQSGRLGKRDFMRFGRMFPEVNSHLVERKRDFMRFGKREMSDQETNEEEALNRLLRSNTAKRDFMRFGKRDFMRFGKRRHAMSGFEPNEESMLKRPHSRHRRSATEKNVFHEKSKRGFMRFGKRGKETDEENQILVSFLDGHEYPLEAGNSKSNLGEGSNEKRGFMRFGKKSDKRGFMRFGKKSDKRGFMRFGKKSDKRGFMRFGKKSDVPTSRFGEKSSSSNGMDSSKRGFMRFGKKSSSPNGMDSSKRGFMRFGKKSTNQLLGKLAHFRNEIISKWKNSPKTSTDKIKTEPIY